MYLRFIKVAHKSNKLVIIVRSEWHVAFVFMVKIYGFLIRRFEHRLTKKNKLTNLRFVGNNSRNTGVFITWFLVKWLCCRE